MRERLELLSSSRLGLFNANIETASYSLQKGAAGLSPIAANAYPEIYAKACRADSISVANENVMNGLDVLISHKYPYSAKRFLQLRGLPINLFCRRTCEQWTEQDEIRLKKGFAKIVPGSIVGR